MEQRLKAGALLFYAAETVFRVTEEARPRRSAAAWGAPVMFCKDASHDIFIDIGVERVIDALGDSWTAKPWVATF